MSGFPVLRIRATDPLRVTELTLDGIDLRPLCVNAVRLDMSAGNLTEATLTFHVIPDIELPAEVKRLMLNPDGVEVNDEGTPVTMLSGVYIPLDEDEPA